MLGFLTLLEFLAQKGFDRRYLDGVQKGFGGTGVTISWGLVVYLFICLLVIVGLVILLRWWLKPKPQHFSRSDLDIIDDKGTIKDIFSRAVALRAPFEMEIHDPLFKEIYVGPIIGLISDSEIALEISAYTDPNLDFGNKATTVVFRMSHRGRQEFYQFDSLIHGMKLVDAAGRRERGIVLSIPDKIQIGQKRRFKRIEPTGKYQFKVQFLTPSHSKEPMPISSFSKLVEADLENVSIGGLQLVIVSRMMDLPIKSGQTVFVHFRLFRGDLNIDNLPREFLIKAKIVSVHRRPTGRKVLSNEMDRTTVGPNIIRLMFTARGIIDYKERIVSFKEANHLAFEDIGRWIQAYQRFRIQEEKGTLAKREPVKNIYAPRKPDVKPRYAAEPLSKKKPLTDTSKGTPEKKSPEPAAKAQSGTGN